MDSGQARISQNGSENMSNSKKIQIRGVCQCCGNFQAVIKSGNMSKHGYTVDGGWFSGVCSGENAKPLQVDRSVLDQVVELIKAQVEGLKIDLDGLKSGKSHPAKVASYPCRVKKELINWSDASEYEKEAGVNSAIYATERRIVSGAQMIGHLLSMADTYHGKDLLEVDVEASKPEPISYTEKRKFESGLIASVSRIEKGRVYWEGVRQNGTPARGWVGTSSWRKMEKVGGAA